LWSALIAAWTRAASSVSIASRMATTRDIRCSIRRPMEAAATAEMQRHGTPKDFANNTREKHRIYR
jgi:hypothetical protein